MAQYNSLNDPFSIDDDDVAIQPDSGKSNGGSKASAGPAAASAPGMQAYEPDLADLGADVEAGAAASGTGFAASPNGHIHKPKKQFKGGPLSLNYYRQYFDLDTGEFFHNIWRAMHPFQKLDDEEFAEVGDIYGAVWITASLILLLFFSNSFAEMLSGWIVNRSEKDTDKKLHVNYFRLLLSSINLLYGYIFLVPTLLWAVLKFYLRIPNTTPISSLISIYAYSNVQWVPSAVLSIFRGLLANHHTVDTVVKWVCIALGALLSGASIFTKLDQYFKLVLDDTEDHKKMAVVLMGLLVIAHIGFALGVKISFFGAL